VDILFLISVFNARTKQLIWYGRVQRMAEERILKQTLNENPPEEGENGEDQKEVGERASMR